MNIGDLFFTLRADGTGLTRDITKEATAAGTAAGTGFGSKFKSAFSRQNIGGGLIQGLGLGAGLAVFSTVNTAIAGTVDFLGQSVDAAREETVAVASLTTALESNIPAWDGNIDAIEETIAAREELGFSDDEQRESLARLVAVTKDENEALDLQRQAMDFARLRGISLASASEILGKVYGGNVGILSRYGFQLEKGITATDALAEIQRRSAGQAEAFGETEQGAADAAAIAFENLQEDVGSLLLPIVKELALFGRDVLIPFLRGVVKAIKDWMKQNKPLLDTLGKIAGVIGKVLVPAIGFVIDVIGKVAAPFLAAIGLIADFIGAIIDGGPKVGGAVNKIVGFIMSIPGRIARLVGKVLGVFVEIGRRVVGTITGGIGKVVDFILSIPGKILGLIGGVGKVATDAAAALLAPFVTVADTIRRIVSDIASPDMPKLPRRLGKGANSSGSPDERAGGGPVSSNRPYLVGERGPELFVPGVSGQVVANHDIGTVGTSIADGGAFNPTINIEGLIPYRDPFEIAQQIRRVREFVVVTPRVEPA